jgi:hypothetical protein
MRGDETTSGSGARDALVTELRRLERALQRAQAELLGMGGGTLPGLHLVFDAGGARGLLPIGRVSEIVRLVATVPLAGAPSKWRSRTAGSRRRSDQAPYSPRRATARARAETSVARIRSGMPARPASASAIASE